MRRKNKSKNHKILWLKGENGLHNVKEKWPDFLRFFTDIFLEKLDFGLILKLENEQSCKNGNAYFVISDDQA